MKQNSNLRWTTAFVNALADAGLRAVCIAPGSRSTPLTLAFAACPRIKIYRHLDERSAAFFALGLAMAWDEPVAAVCTSGTAAANFFPAVIEANMSQIPLLVLTADRPHELRHSGANQTIDQVKLYGDHVLWAVGMPVPDFPLPSPPQQGERAQPPLPSEGGWGEGLSAQQQLAMRNYVVTAVRAYHTANGRRKGPIHLNMPFRKPLEPTADQRSPAARRPPTASDFTIAAPLFQRPGADEVNLEWLDEIVGRYGRGLIVCGPRCPGGDFPQAVAALSRKTGYPIMADALSGLRYGEWVDGTAVVSQYETFLQTDPGWPEPEVIIRFGAVPVSKWLNDYLGRVRPTYRVHIRENGVWADDSHLTSHFVEANETAVCKALTKDEGRGTKDEGWTAAVMERETAVGRIMEQELAGVYFDGAIVADVVKALPAGANLFVGNSLPMRHLDQYGAARVAPLNVYGIRGASGIDGNVSIAAAIAAASERPTVAILGDVTFYHDMNGLLALRGSLQPPGNITYVVVNNNSGGIFRRLPIAQFDPPFTDLFLTPHDLDFGLTADLYDLHNAKVHERVGFRDALAAAVADPAPHLIEVVTDGANDDAIRRQINAIAKQAQRINN
jgi:2-succinyl-5-enolpyruvyl-6-hydroxy-3-cyclohexene-1-carboxylate synthase